MNAAALRAHLHILAEEIVRERESEEAVTDEDIMADNMVGSLQGTHPYAGCLRQLKALLAARKFSISVLWGEENQSYTDSGDRIGEIIGNSGQARQGRPRGEKNIANHLLAHSRLDLSNCRQTLEAHEILTMILSSPKSKRPGPNGIPAIAQDL